MLYVKQTWFSIKTKAHLPLYDPVGVSYEGVEYHRAKIIFLKLHHIGSYKNQYEKNFRLNRMKNQTCFPQYINNILGATVPSKWQLFYLRKNTGHTNMQNRFMHSFEPE